MEEGTETPEATDPGLNATSAIYQRHDRGRPSRTLILRLQIGGVGALPRLFWELDAPGTTGDANKSSFYLP